MAKTTFSKLKLKMPGDIIAGNIVINEVDIPIKGYLTQQEKADLISFVLENSVDSRGCFSPVRVETFWGIAIVKWYADIAFTDKQIFDAGKTYDILETNNVIGSVIEVIPTHEYEYLTDMMNETKADIERYNNSFAGMVAAAAGSANNMDTELTELLTKIQNGEGLEQLAVVKDIVG